MAKSSPSFEKRRRERAKRERREGKAKRKAERKAERETAVENGTFVEASEEEGEGDEPALDQLTEEPEDRPEATGRSESEKA